MSVMSIRIPDETRKKLKVVASIEGKTMSSLVSDLIEEYVAEAGRRMQDKAEIQEVLDLNSDAFSEWKNEEDEVYNDL